VWGLLWQLPIIRDVLLELDDEPNEHKANPKPEDVGREI